MISVGLHLPHFGPLAQRDVLTRSIRLAEELGFDTAWVGDHVAIPVGFETPYPYTQTGRIGLPWDAPFIDPFVTLAFFAGQTQKIRLGISALVVPYRHPLLAAKLIGSLDALSGGRARIVLGAGWLKEEFDALEVDFARRGRITDDYVNALSALLNGGRAAFSGEIVSFSEMGMEPAPAERPFPLLVGGHSRPAMRRALRLGYGWQATPESPEQVADMISRLREEAGGELPRGFLVATRLHLPRFDPNTSGAQFLEAMRTAVRPGVADLTVDVYDHDPERYYERLRTLAGWLELKDGTTEVLN